MAVSSFSIVVDNYNYARFLERALASALGQDYPQELVEIVVVDDGSSDGSADLLRRYAAHPRVKVLLQQNGGQAVAFASGAAHATGDYVCLLDADDAFLPHKLRALDERIGALGAPGGDLFLCHDLELCDEQRKSVLEETWFGYMGLPDIAQLGIAEARHAYPFAVPSGQVYSRRLLAEVLEAIPAADWRTGADNPLAHAALLRAGIVHFVRQPLARYFIHGDNRLLAIEGLKVVRRPDAHHRLLQRRPKLLWFLERYLDTLALSLAGREERIAYLKRLEATLPVSAAQAALPDPKLSFVVDAGAGVEGLQETLEALARQTHERFEVLVACDGAPEIAELVEAFAAAHRGASWRAVAGEAAGSHALLRALKQVQGEFLALVAAGDRPDRGFTERHLYHHRYHGSASVSTCDFRLDLGGQIVNDRCYGSRNFWPPRRKLLPYLAEKPAGGWWFCPRSGSVLRREAAIDLFVDHCLERGVPAGIPLEWLLLHYAAALGGCFQFAECLVTLRMQRGDPAGMHVRHPRDQRFAPRLAQPDAARFYLELLSARFAGFNEQLGDHWVRLARWATRIDAPGNEAAVRETAGAMPLHPAVTAVLARPAALAAGAARG